MPLNAVDVHRNVRWLLENASPPVKYLTHKHLLRTPPRSRAMKELWAAVETCDDAREIFSKQRADGSWCDGGSWAPKPSYIPQDGYSPFTPKYVTAVWLLSALGDMGFTVKDARVRKACEYAMGFQWPNGLFDRFNFGVDRASGGGTYGEDPGNNPCDLAMYLTAFGKVAMGGDPRLRKSYGLLLKWQREDGGWIGQKHKEERNWYRSCPAATSGCVSALYHSGNPAHREPLRKGMAFLAWHLSTKREEEIRTFFFHGHNMVRELVIRSETGAGMADKPVRAIIDWLMSMYRPDEGRVRYDGTRGAQVRSAQHSAKVLKYFLYHLVEDDWLTYYMTRIAGGKPGTDCELP